MKAKYVSDYLPNQNVDDVFLVIRKEIRPKKQGGDFIFTVLADRTGAITAFLWDNVDVFRAKFDVDQFVHVIGMTKEFNNATQITIHKIRRVESDQVELDDFIRKSHRDTDQSYAALLDCIHQEVTDPYLRRLLLDIFGEPELQARFKQCPAAKALHHAYIGGLLDHTLSVMQLCIRICQHYPFLNKSMLLAGAALHDIGKLDELVWGKSIDYTDEGRLVGHITMEAILLDRRMSAVPDFPADLRMELLHLVISHHRELEFGSPKRPKTLEALALSYLDDLDAKLGTFLEAIQQAGESDHWTPYNTNLQRFIYRRSAAEDKPAEGGGTDE
ncbi:MAG TPA: HD domain-containing protein [Acidobacteriota bacterium]|nr:HD domain-containing protein [Acidobacteriota bacterium]HQM62466.1 HD domain-containing protein [Acidobacteriota bacterium]